MKEKGKPNNQLIRQPWSREYERGEKKILQMQAYSSGRNWLLAPPGAVDVSSEEASDPMSDCVDTRGGTQNKPQAHGCQGSFGPGEYSKAFNFHGEMEV